MRILNIVDRSLLAIILLAVFGEYIWLPCFPEQGVSSVFLICENAHNYVVLPLVLSQLCFDAICSQPLCDLGDRVSGDELSVDPSDDFRFLFVYLEHIVTVFVFPDLPVSEHQASVQHDVAILEFSLVCPPDIAADRPAFLFGHRGEDRQKHFATGRQRVDVLALEVDADPQILQFADVVERIHRVPGEAADRLDQYLLDLSGAAVLDHPEEVRSFLCAGAADAGIRVDVYVFPFRL